MWPSLWALSSASPVPALGPLTCLGSVRLEAAPVTARGPSGGGWMPFTRETPAKPWETLTRHQQAAARRGHTSSRSPALLFDQPRPRTAHSHSAPPLPVDKARCSPGLPPSPPPRGRQRSEPVGASEPGAQSRAGRTPCLFLCGVSHLSTLTEALCPPPHHLLLVQMVRNQKETERWARRCGEGRAGSWP